MRKSGVTGTRSVVSSSPCSEETPGIFPRSPKKEHTMNGECQEGAESYVELIEKGQPGQIEGI